MSILYTDEGIENQIQVLLQLNYKNLKKGQVV